MSAPARTWFCGAGHIIASYGHGECGSYKEKTVCWCGLAESFCQIEWGNDDNAIQYVPTKPIGADEKKCVDYKGNKFYVLINKYDITKLKEERIL